MKYGRFFFFFLSIFLVHGKFLRHDDTYTDDGINYRTEARSNNVDMNDQYVLNLPRASNETDTEEHVLTLPRASNENCKKCVCYAKENTTGIFFDVTIVLDPNEESF